MLNAVWPRRRDDDDRDDGPAVKNRSSSSFSCGEWISIGMVEIGGWAAHRESGRDRCDSFDGFDGFDVSHWFTLFHFNDAFTFDDVIIEAMVALFTISKNNWLRSGRLSDARLGMCVDWLALIELMVGWLDPIDVRQMGIDCVCDFGCDPIARMCFLLLLRLLLQSNPLSMPANSVAVSVLFKVSTTYRSVWRLLSSSLTSLLARYTVLALSLFTLKSRIIVHFFGVRLQRFSLSFDRFKSHMWAGSLSRNKRTIRSSRSLDATALNAYFLRAVSPVCFLFLLPFRSSGHSTRRWRLYHSRK